MANILVTGGAGFIGSNLVARLLKEGHQVVLYDNLSRRGAASNAAWLHAAAGRGQLRLIEADVRDFEQLQRAAEGVQRVYHLAGQVAVTTSVADPRSDFLDNALGTFKVLSCH